MRSADFTSSCALARTRYAYISAPTADNRVAAAKHATIIPNRDDFRTRASSHSFIFGVTQLFQVAVDALWFAGKADAASVPDQLMGELDPLFFWDYGH